MSNSHPRRLNGFFGKRAPKERRPTGVSRRQKRQFGFEPLEDRRVMAEGTPTTPGWDGRFDTYQSFSSNTAAGAAALTAQENYWQSLIAGASPKVPTATESIPTDPLLALQWHLINVGQQVGNPDWQPIYGIPGNDVNVAPVWMNGYTGAGVTVGVIDSGVQVNHPDLAANISSIPGLNAAGSGSNGNPTPNQDGGPHGTAVAGIIAAVANNGIGGTGIAPGASIVPIRLIAGAATTNPNSTIDAFRYRIQDIDITNNSWGSPIPRTLAPLSTAEVQALRDSVIFGRQGKGVIHVFSSGNNGGLQFAGGFGGGGGLDSSIYDGWKNSRYTIAVGGYDHDGLYYNPADGTIMNYPEAGANVLIVAPTGSNGGIIIGDDDDIGSGIVTTDLTGTIQNGLGGYNVPPHPTQGEIYDRDFLPDGNYGSRFNGTSAAAPMVTGVIALMLEANPELSWRDVQEILVRSARQVAPTEIPTNGYGVTTQNPWIVNQQRLFQDPDIYDDEADVSPFEYTLDPVLDPTTNQPHSYTNGAGYTVSEGYGVYSEKMGYAHGAVDADLAVKLAEQWHTKGQNLGTEQTFSSYVTSRGVRIAAGERSNDDSGNQFVPGGLGGQSGWINYWEEYFKTGDEPPFSQDNPPTNRRGASYIEFNVPENNRMSVETVEVKVNIGGGTAAALDNLRLVLVSPNGTHSELNHYYYSTVNSTYQTLTPGLGISVQTGRSGDNGGNLIWSFTTNRSWGELTDDALVKDPATGEPMVDPETGEPTGETKGWRVYVENYATTPFVLNALEVVWHGNKVAASAQRIQGVIGIDDNGDGQFNHSRVQITSTDEDQIIRLSEVTAELDQTERFAGNVTVVARRTSDGVQVAEFVTGADGNYYFDLPAGEYDISVIDPLGRNTLVDKLTVTNDELVRNVNFILDPGTTATPEATISGNLLADFNGDGISNGDDVPAAGQTVYVDVNRNGIFDAGEQSTVTDANGNYQIIVPNITANTVVDVRVVLATGWTAVTPLNAMSTLLLQQGVSIGSVNFAIMPPPNGGGGGGGGGIDPATPATLIGYVFADPNQSGTRDNGEVGLANVRVYIDANGDRQYNDGEQTTFTNSQGAYTFSVFAGQHRIRVVAETPYAQTTPTSSAGSRIVNVAAGGTISGLAFGLYNSANFDYGDLPVSYDITTGGANPPKHRKSDYWLGTRWDGELGPQNSANADGDDLSGFSDDDGVVFDPIIAGNTVRLVVTANRYNGYLKGWIDWNNNGTFDAEERLVFSGIGAPTDNVLLQMGSNVLYIQVPAGIVAEHVFARFRFGEHTTAVSSNTPVAGAINTPYGAAQIGEVEDYRLTVAPSPAAAIVTLGSDYNGDGRVDGKDFLYWQRNYGKTGQIPNDANKDKVVNGADLTDWKSNFGNSQATPAMEAASASTSTTASTPLLTSESSAAAASTAEVFTPAFSSVVTVSASTLPLGLSSNVAVRDEAAGRFESRPMLAALAGKLTDVADRLRQRADKLEDRADDAREFVVEWLTDAADRVDGFSFENVRRDRAFDDLFGSRRRQGLRAEHAEEAGDELDSDAAFAVFAEHFEVPRG